MNPELKVGIPAMIIGCLNPENSHKIGKVVELVYCIPVGDFVRIPQDFTLHGLRLGGPMDNESWIVQGITSHSGVYKEGFSCFDARHLMPLPPLDDDAIIFRTETPKETETC